MTPLRIELLDPIKLPLVTRLYKAHYPSAKAKKNETTIVCYQYDALCGVVRFRPLDTFRLLTGMLVLPEYRGQGVAHQLMHYCQQHILGHQDYCFAYTHLAPFYAQHGFVSVSTEQLPPPLKELFERYCRSGKQLVAMHFKHPTGLKPGGS